MESALKIEALLSQPALLAGQEPEEPLYALLRLEPHPVPERPRLEFACLLDTSASMYQFRLEPQERERWRRVAEERGDVERRFADGREALVWRGRTLQELEQQVSTPMLSAVRGLWRGLQSLAEADAVAVVGFGEAPRSILDDPGGRPADARLREARERLALLGQPLTASGLEQPTRLAEALEALLARWEKRSPTGTARRVLLLSDGVVADASACLRLAEEFAARQLVVSVVGVGENFDEEFLMRVADLTRGNYVYAPTAPDVERALTAEFEQLGRVGIRGAQLAVQFGEAALPRGIHQLAPQLAAFPLLWADEGLREVSLADLPAGEAVELLLELAPAAPAAGQVDLACVVLRGRTVGEGRKFQTELPLRVIGTDDPALARAREDRVLDAARRLAIYLEERRAQEALERGEGADATRHLLAATRLLRQLGAEGLAGEMETAAGEIEAGTRSLSRTKRIKSATRRLGRPTE